MKLTKEEVAGSKEQSPLELFSQRIKASETRKVYKNSSSQSM